MISGAIVQCALEGCEGTFVPTRPGAHRIYCTEECSRRANKDSRRGLSTTASEWCANCGKGIAGQPPKANYGPRYCDAKCREARELIKPRGPVPRRDPYCTTCSMCGRVSRYLQLTDAQLRALRPLPRCEHCGGATWVEPFETTAHRVGDVAAGRTARAVAGWSYRESVGEMAG